MLELFVPWATVKMTGVRGTSLWELGGGVCTTSALVISNQSLPFFFFFSGKQHHLKATEQSGQKIRAICVAEQSRQLTYPERKALNPKTQAIKRQSKP